MIRHLIFDLDDTLLDTTRLLRPIAETPAFHTRISQPLPLMPGAKENLTRLRGSYRLFLLTLGHVKDQQQKVKSLGIAEEFESIVYVDSQKEASKLGGFQRIRDKICKDGATFLSIGNRRSMDVREAKQCGMRTCLFKYGEHQEEAILIPEDIPDFEINSHAELIQTCQL